MINFDNVSLLVDEVLNGDPIDLSEVSFTLEAVKQLMLNSAQELYIDQIENESTEAAQTMMMAIITKLLIENFVYHNKALSPQPF